MPANTIAMYARMSPQTSSGTCKKLLMRSRHANARPFKSSVTPKMSTNEARTLSFKAVSSRCPKRMENSAPLPMHSPSKIDVKNVISENEEPTAASAVLPRKRHTMSVTEML